MDKYNMWIQVGLIGMLVFCYADKQRLTSDIKAETKLIKEIL